ncbi:MAG: MmgE/PrpD family protein [Halobacteriales archaeon]
MTHTAALADRIADTDFEAYEESTVDQAKQAIRDYVGCAIYGYQHPIGERIREYVEAALPGQAASILGGGSASPAGAALVNGTIGHAIDYDDTFESIVLHPTSPVFPAAFAMAETADADGQELVTGYITGVETAYQLGHATNPGHYDHGFHNTGTIGSFGSTAAAASVLGLDAEATAKALGIVASTASSLKRNFGSMTKPLHAGHAAQMGVRAAMLADSGFTADDAILDDEMGYGAVMTPDGTYDPTPLEADFADGDGVADIGYKPYPSGVITHAAMEALRRIVLAEDLTPADVETITVTLDDAASEMLIHAQPENALQAKFSIEFCLVAILRERTVGVKEFSDEYVTEAATREQLGKVERAFEPNLFGDRFAGYGARVVVETTDGRRIAAEERQAPGSPSNPVGEKRLKRKFEQTSGVVLNRSAVTRLDDAIDRLETEQGFMQFRRTIRG